MRFAKVGFSPEKLRQAALMEEKLPVDERYWRTHVLWPLYGHPDLARAAHRYEVALQELRPTGEPGHAITQAGTALQEMLSAMGAKGNRLGGLVHDARQRGMLGPYDSKLADGIES